MNQFPAIPFIRTPDSRFEQLHNYPFKPHYQSIQGLRMHYVDEGPHDAPVVLMLHGEPSWSYLYRKMIPHFSSAGLRAVAPDLIGFGRSDKPIQLSDYTYQRHVDWMSDWLQALDLQRITLVCQDWGSLIGLRLAAQQPQRFERIVVANGALPTGDEQFPLAFKLWRAFALYSPWFPVDRIIRAGCAAPLSKAVRHAYRAPFPDTRYLAGARAFPRLVPTTPGNPASQPNREAWQVLQNWEKPFLTLFGNRDPITRPMAKVFQQRIPGAANQPHTLLRPAGHFIQEDQGAQLALQILDWLQQLP